jgi:hypothetical protein
MALDRFAGEHDFGLSDVVCSKCGMSREEYENTGKPRCKGKAPDADRTQCGPTFVEEE